MRIDTDLRITALTKSQEIGLDLIDAIENRTITNPAHRADALFFIHHLQKTGFATANSVDINRELKKTIELLSNPTPTSGSDYVGPGLLGGLFGLCWIVHNLEPQIFKSFLQGADRVAARIINNGQSTDRWDFSGGWVGLGHYLCERHRSGSNQSGVLDELILKLEEIVRKDDFGYYWKNLQDYGDHTKDGINVGLAHGILGIIGFLSQTTALGIASQKSKELLSKSTDWLLANERHYSPYGFPKSFVGNEQRDSTLSGWCYGNPGIAVVLSQAAFVLQNRGLQKESERIFEIGLKREVENPHLRDAGLCHGYMGLSLICNRFRNSQNFLNDLVKKSITFSGENRGYGGFGSCIPKEFVTSEDQVTSPIPNSTSHVWRKDPSILTGSAGIGLALLSFCDHRVQGWERMMMFSLPEMETH